MPLKNEKPTARSSTFSASFLRNKRTFTSPPPPMLNDYYNNHVMKYSNNIPVLLSELNNSKINRIKEVLEGKRDTSAYTRLNCASSDSSSFSRRS